MRMFEKFKALNPLEVIRGSETEVVGIVGKIIPAIDDLRERGDDISKKKLEIWNKEFRKYGFRGVDHAYQELSSLKDDYFSYIKRNAPMALGLYSKLGQIKRFLKDQNILDKE